MRRAAFGREIPTMIGYTGRSSSRSTRTCFWLRGASCSALRWNPLSSLNHTRISPELAQNTKGLWSHQWSALQSVTWLVIHEHAGPQIAPTPRAAYVHVTCGMPTMPGPGMGMRFQRTLTLWHYTTYLSYSRNIGESGQIRSLGI